MCYGGFECAPRGALRAWYDPVTTEQFAQAIQGKMITAILLACLAGILVTVGGKLFEKAVISVMRIIKYGPRKAPPIFNKTEQDAFLDAGPRCPNCRGEMIQRTAKTGEN